MTEWDAEAGQAKREELMAVLVERERRGRRRSCDASQLLFTAWLEALGAKHSPPVPAWVTSSSRARLGDIQPHACGGSLSGTQVSCRRRQSNPPTCIVLFLPYTWAPWSERMRRTKPDRKSQE